MRLRSIELALPGAAAAADWLADIWGLARAPVADGAHYLRGSGSYPYLVALREAAARSVTSVTFVCEAARVARIAGEAAARGLAHRPVASFDPGGGSGVLVELAEGEILRFLSGAAEVAPLADAPDMPVRLTHVVFNSIDAEASGHLVEDALGFTVSDRTKGMVFVRCNEKHHSTAFARAGFASLNHIAFEMTDLEAVMRGIGRMRDHGHAPAWGPGRHGPGDNAFAYYVAPFGGVVEYSTPVETVGEDYPTGTPEDWTWPEGRIDQWGISDKDMAALRPAEEAFRFVRDWAPAPFTAATGV